jgi:hypothetical protein
MASIRRIVAVAVAGLCLAGAWTATAAGDGAFTQHFSFVTTLQEELTNPCTGEPFTSNDVFRDEITTTQTPSGNTTVEDHEVATFSGVSPSGARYEGTLVGDLNALVQSGQMEVQILTNPTIHWIRTGEDGTQEDYYDHAVLLAHLDLQTQTYTLQIEHVSSECR